jgi:tRNA A-37 threonylcarbamoyl transferase component Bud32
MGNLSEELRRNVHKRMYKKYHAYVMKKYKNIMDRTIREFYPTEKDLRSNPKNRAHSSSFSNRISHEKNELLSQKKTVSEEYASISRSRDFMDFLRNLIHRRILMYEMRKNIQKRIAGENLLACLKSKEDEEGARYLNEGDYGKVYRLGPSKCVKIINISESELQATDDRIDDIFFPREVEISKKAGELGIGPKIEDAYICFQENDSSCHGVIYMEWLEGKTLYDWLSKGRSTEEIAKVRDLVEAKIQKMHAHGIIHMDLHNGNVFILLDAKGEVKDVSFIDYGFARYIKELVTTRNRGRIDKYLFFKSREYIYKRLTDLILRKISFL